jgi:hypothetical protein
MVEDPPCFETSPHVLRPQRSRVALAKIVQAAEEILRKNCIDVFSTAAIGEDADLPIGNTYRRRRAEKQIRTLCPRPLPLLAVAILARLASTTELSPISRRNTGSMAIKSTRG